MSIPFSQKQVADQAIAIYCQRKLPHWKSGPVNLAHRWRGTRVTLLEQRRHRLDPSLWGDNPIAQFRFDPEHGAWTLYWRDRNQRWRPYQEHPGSRSIERLLEEVDQDPAGIFWA
jgi:hypothetical protein